MCNVYTASARWFITTADTRTAIVDATDRLLARHGYRRISMEDIAQEAGVGRRTVYTHFRSREDVCLACADRIIEELHRAIDDIAQSKGSPQKRLREILCTRVLFLFDRAQDNYQKYLDLFVAIRPAYLARREEYIEAEAIRLQQVITEGIRARAFVTDDVPLTAKSLILATNALMPFTLSPRQLQARKEVIGQLEHIVNLLLDGLCTRS